MVRLIETDHHYIIQQFSVEHQRWFRNSAATFRKDGMRQIDVPYRFGKKLDALKYAQEICSHLVNPHQTEEIDYRKFLIPL